MAGHWVSAWYVVALALALTLVCFVLLAQPRTEMDWEAYAPHFWFVRVSAGVSTVVAYATGASVVQRGDALVLGVEGRRWRRRPLQFRGGAQEAPAPAPQSPHHRLAAGRQRRPGPRGLPREGPPQGDGRRRSHR